MGANQVIKPVQIAPLTAAQLASSSVTSSAIAAGAVGPNALNVSVAGTGLTGGGGSPLAVNNATVAFLAGTQTFTGAKTFSSNIIMSGGATIKGLPFPVNPGDAASKAYVDSVIQGLALHPSSRLATTGALPSNTYVNRFEVAVDDSTGFTPGDSVNDGSGNTGIIFAVNPFENEISITVTAGTWSSSGNINDTTSSTSATYINGAAGPGSTLTATGNGALTVDSVLVATNDRILVKNEATQSHNGIYVVVQPGTGSLPYVLLRAEDFDETTGIHPDLAPGSYTFVTAGTSNSFSGWVLTSSFPVTVGSTAITFTQFSGAGGGGGISSAGDGLQLIGSEVSLLPNPTNPTIAASPAGTSVLLATPATNVGGLTATASGLSANIEAAGTNTGGLTIISNAMRVLVDNGAAIQLTSTGVSVIGGTNSDIQKLGLATTGPQAGSPGKAAWANHVHPRDFYRETAFTSMTAGLGAQTPLSLAAAPIQGAADTTTKGNKMIQLYLNGILLLQGGTDTVSGDYHVSGSTATYHGGLPVSTGDTFIACFYSLT